jgi:serine phosphatase RsbU (regulator of sigma subunit)
LKSNSPKAANRLRFQLFQPEERSSLRGALFCFAAAGSSFAILHLPIQAGLISMSNSDARRPFLAGFNLLRFQLVLLAVAIVACVLRWAFHAPTRILSTLLYTFIAGNVVILLLLLGRPLFGRLAQRETRHREMQWQLQSHVQLGLNEKQTLQSDLNHAQEIQMHLLPRETPQLTGFQIACAWQPARSVSGDYFDVLSLGKGKVGLCIADVSGKGVAAALLMANFQASVKAFAREDLSPASLCSRLNSVLCDNIAPGRFVTFFYAVLDQETRALRYESAGHCLPLLVHGDGTIKFPEASSGVLGLFSHWTYSDHELQLASGDVLVLLTDGVLQAWNAEEEEFGYKRLIESVLASRGQGAHGIRTRVLEDVAAFCNGRFHDDASLIVVTVD